MKRDYSNKTATEWYYFLTHDFSTIPFYFTYNGKKYGGFGSDDFALSKFDLVLGKGFETTKLGFNMMDGLSVYVDITHYFNYGVTEWTVYFENNGKNNSGIIENPHTYLVFEGKLPVLKGILGDHANQYAPYSIDMTRNYVDFSSDSGRATHGNFPYFNLEHGDGGTMLAIGWAGSWRAQFSSDRETTSYTASSVNGLKTYLKPGEKIRTALFVMGSYEVRNEHYATNYWRDWFIKHNLPPADSEGAPLLPFSTAFLAHDTGRPNSDGSISETYETWRPSMEKIISEGIEADFRWFDAGWYVAPDLKSAESYVPGRDWWDTVGTWELDPVKWPGKTFLESTDFARANGMKTLVWFEPERVTDPENLAKNFGYNPNWAIKCEGVHAISNNIGDPDCYRWTVDRICKFLRENKVEMYREDNNSDPRALWNHLDSIEGENRVGITECKFIDAHYRMWDEFIACTLSIGGCGFVDSCASGGGRNDLESMRRGIPLLRSDSDRTSTSLRLSMTTAFNKWIPFCGANTREKTAQLDKKGITDVYTWRASYLPALNIDSQYVYDESQNFDMLRFGIKEWKKLKPYLLKEFYTLTPWRKEQNKGDFTAFCYFDPETDSAALLVFRQEHCPRKEITLSLPFSYSGSLYTASDEDSGEVKTVSNLITVTLDEPRSAKLIWLKKKEI